MDCIDLRSDTVTWPTDEMREAMANAKVGDAVWGDDPTVLELQGLAAEMTGKEAAVFVPSGTMANLAAMLSHCSRGDEVILGDRSHVFRFEGGGISALGSLHPHIVPNQDDGTLNLEDVEAAIRPPGNDHFPTTRAVVIENTHNICSGAAIPVSYFADLEQLAKRNDLKIHLDGARIFNAATAHQVEVTDYTNHVDSVSLCLSKNLCAPVGSMLCGNSEYIGRANKIRKMLGGGWRQAGVLAAAGIIALRKMTKRLAEDHESARILSEGLSRIDSIEIDLDKIHTNMVYFGLDIDHPVSPDELIQLLDDEYNVKIDGRGGNMFRAVTHYWISAQDAAKAAEAIKEILSQA